MDGKISLWELMDFIDLFKNSAIVGYHYDGVTMSSYIDGCIVGYAAGKPRKQRLVSCRTVQILTGTVSSA